jgi:photosystem II stability/assembly factor-like uncharacterized protein
MSTSDALTWGRSGAHTFLRRCLVAAVAAGAALAPGGSSAQQGPVADWEATALAGPVRRLFVTADGALLARTSQDLLQRSDDGGTTFHPIQLPPGQHALEVDPTSADVIYVAGGGEGQETGLYKSADGGATYDLILPGRIAAVTVSPAAPGLVYVAVEESTSRRVGILWSRDGGANFEQVDEMGECYPLTSAVSLSLLVSDAADPQRVWLSAGCVTGRVVAGLEPRSLERSQDQGETWTIVARTRGFPSRLVGVRGGPPGRYYLSATVEGSTRLYRSDDGGDSFNETFQFPSFKTELGSGPVYIIVGGIAFDPTAPDRVFVGRKRAASNPRALELAPPAGGVLVSEDGGQRFAELGRQDIGEVNDVALSADGQTLYAAADNGLFRLAVRAARPRVPAQVPPLR